MPYWANQAGDTVTGLSTLSVTGTTTIKTSAISTSNTQMYSGAYRLPLGTDTTLTALTITGPTITNSTVSARQTG